MGGKDKMDVDLLEDDYDEEEEDTQEDKYLTFFMNDEEFGLEIRHVTEIIGIQTITDVPDMSSYIKGVINLRGKVIPVMDVRLRFGIEPREYDDRTCIIVINIDGQSMGLVVDRVCEVLDIPKGQIEPAPDLGRKKGNKFIWGMGKAGDKVKMLLETKQLLYAEE